MRIRYLRKWISSVVIAIFLVSQTALLYPTNAFSQSSLNLPAPGVMIGVSPSYNPAILAGITVYPDNPLQFDFIVDVGDDYLHGEELRKESEKLISYFMATLTVPEEEMWVNLSPYEKERIIADGLGDTVMGRDMLAQDYILKQLTASIMYPEDKLGSEFWQRVYKKAQDKFGTTEIPTNTFSKIWIIPEEAVIYAKGTSIFVADSHLKVMMEEDYLALEHHDKGLDANAENVDMTQEAKAIWKEVLLPEIEKEVNEGKNFAPLRQIYHSMILATWYKNNLKESLLGKVYVNQNKVEGVDVEDKQVKNKIYNQYVEAFNKGVYDYVREDYDGATQEVVPRQYFSGGEDFAQLSEEAMSVRNSISKTDWIERRSNSPKVRVRTQAKLGQSSFPIDLAMLSVEGVRFDPELDFKQGVTLSRENIESIRLRRTRGVDDVLRMLRDAQSRDVELTITGHLRGVDGPGSSLDLPEFQDKLTEQGVRGFDDLPSTPTIASDFTASVRFELADDPNQIVYVAPDYGIDEENPYIFNEDVQLVNGRTPKGQLDGVGFIMSNIFGLRGVKITMDSISPMALAGGMESSNVFNTALIAAASMFTGANLSAAEIFNLAVKLENDEFGGLTGGQGHLSTILGGAYRHIWLSGIRDGEGDLINPYSAVSMPLLSDENLDAIENHMMLVQAGKEYKDGNAVVKRTAALINYMWTDLLRDKDEIGFPLHQEKIALTAKYTKALQDGDFNVAAQVMIRYVDIREELVRRWLGLMLDARNNVDGTPEYAQEYARKVFNMPQDDPAYNDYKVARDIYDSDGEEVLRNSRLYTYGKTAELIDIAKQEGIAIMPLGAGGPGANLVAIHPEGIEKLKTFLERPNIGIGELNEERARTIIRGTGELKGYMEFKVGREPMQFNGFEQVGMVNPTVAALATVTDSDAGLNPDAAMLSFGNLRMSQRILDKMTTINKAGRYQITSRKRQNHDLITIDDTASQSSFTVMPDRGFTLTSFMVDGEDVFNYPEDVEEHGGIFWMYPFVNRLEGGQFEWNGQQRNINNIEGVTYNEENPIHGLVRHKLWNIEDVGEDEEGLYFKASIKTEDFPEIAENFGRSELTITYRLKGNQMMFDVEVENTDDVPVIADVGGHEYGYVNHGDTTLRLNAQKVYESQGNIPSGQLSQVAGVLDFREARKTQGGQLDHVFTDIQTDPNGRWEAVIEDSANNRRRTILVDGEMFPVATVWDGNSKIPNNLSVEFQTAETNGVNNLDSITNFRLLQVGEVRKGRVVMTVEDTAQRKAMLSPAMIKTVIGSEATRMPEVIERDGKTYLRVKTKKGIYRLEMSREQADGYSIDRVENNAGGVWLQRSDSPEIEVISEPTSPFLPEPYLMSDTYFDTSWTNEEIPRLATKVVDQLIVDNNYTSDVVAELRELARKINDKETVESIPEDSKGDDAVYWNEDVMKDVLGQGMRWGDDIPHNLAAAYLYRLILEKVNYWETRADPFAAEKQKALAEILEFPGGDSELQDRNDLTALMTRFEGASDPFSFLLDSSLWTNNYDPSNPIDPDGDQNYLVDDRKAIIDALSNPDVTTVEFDTDNAGPEITSDLWLAQYMLDNNVVDQITLNVKNYPFLVSDTTEEDVLYTIDQFKLSADGRIVELGNGLIRLLGEGKLVIASHKFSTSGQTYDQMPDELRNRSDLKFVDGDWNYRMVTGNRRWGIDQDIRDVLDAIMGSNRQSIVIKRTVKNETVVGAQESMIQTLFGKSLTWFREGLGGMLQFGEADVAMLIVDKLKEQFGEVAHQPNDDVVFLKQNVTFSNSQGESEVGTLVADPKKIRFDIQVLQNAQGNLSITDRNSNKRVYQPSSTESQTSDSKAIRSLYLPFNSAMEDSLAKNPGTQSLTWLDFSNNFGNPEHISFANGELHYPTGTNLGKKFEQSFDSPFYSVVQRPDGDIEFAYVQYEVTNIERVEGYYDKVSAKAFIDGEELDSNAVIFSAIPLVANGKKIDLTQAIRNGIFQDLRHLYVFPPIKHSENVRPGEYALDDVPAALRAGVFFGLGQLSANDYEKAAKALYEPIKLSTELPISDKEVVNLNKNQMRTLLATRDYEEETDEGRIQRSEPREGRYIFTSESEILIFLKPNPYPHQLVGRTKEGNIMIQAIGGASGSIGVTVKELFEYAGRLELTDLMTISQGTGAALGYNEQGQPTYESYRAIVGPSEGRKAGSAVINIVTDNAMLSVNVTADNVDEEIGKVLNLNQGERAVLIVNTGFEKSNETTINFLNSGRTGIIALKGPNGVFSEFFFDGHPKAVQVSRQDLETVGIEVPQSGVLDPWEQEDRTELKEKILALKERAGIPLAAVERLEEKKFETLGDAKKIKISDEPLIFGQGDTAYANFHILDLRVKDTQGNEYVVRTYQNSPVITDEVEILGVGPETIKVWGKIVQDAKTVIVVGNDTGFEDVLNQEIEGQTRLLVSENDDETIAKLSQKETWDAALLASSPLGGIDFNAGNLNLKEQGQATDINFTNLPNVQANTVNGVTPVIINITPIANFPFLLGLKEEEDEQELSFLY